jgi:hypothetical protein
MLMNSHQVFDLPDFGLDGGVIGTARGFVGSQSGSRFFRFLL